LKYVVEYANKNLAAVHKQPEMKMLGFGSAPQAGDIHSQADAVMKGTK
jgi:hypothetical protein